MSLTAVGDPYSGLRERLRELTGGGLDRCLPVEEPAEFERIALKLLGPFADPAMPADAAALLADALAARGDELASGLLAVLERLAPGPVAKPAKAARTRLTRRGVATPFEHELGALTLEETYAVEFPGEHPIEIVGALLRRAHTQEAQAALLVLERGPWGAAIVEGHLSDPKDADTLRQLLLRPREGVEAQPLEASALARTLLGALGRMVEHERPLRADLLAPVLVLERALAARVANWPVPTIAPLRPLPSEDADDAALSAAALEELVESFGDSLPLQDPLDGRVLEYGPFVARTLGGWKLDYAVDTRLERWSTAELHDFLLDWYPRAGDPEPGLVAAFAVCAGAFFGFLSDSGRLLGDPLEELLATLVELRARFEQAAVDRTRFGIGKALIAAIVAEGIDPADGEAVDDWLAAFGRRSSAERERALGPAAAALRPSRALATRPAPRPRGAGRRPRRPRAEPRLGPSPPLPSELGTAGNGLAG